MRMTFSVTAVTIFSLFVRAPGAEAQGARSAPLATQITHRIALVPGAEVAVSYRDMGGPDSLDLNAAVDFHAASTMKIPVMIELYRQVHDKKIELDEPLTVRNEFHSLADNSIYRLDAGDDSEAALYQAEGQTRTVAELCELMITVSSNLATNLLIEKLGVENIKATVQQLNAGGMKFLRGVEDNKAFEKGLNNTTTARGLLVLMEAIAKDQAVDAEASRAMLEILKRQKFNQEIPAGLPAGTVVAHKTGEITKIHHDAAIVYAARPYVLVILVRGISEEKESAVLMANISRELYRATQ